LNNFLIYLWEGIYLWTLGNLLPFPLLVLLRASLDFKAAEFPLSSFFFIERFSWLFGCPCLP